MADRFDMNKASRADFLAVPQREDWNEEVVCHSLVIVPVGSKHDSGFGAMAFVAMDTKGQPICKMAGGSDAVHFDGIGGFGKNWLARCGGVPAAVSVSGWCIDCLAKSRLLRLFCGGEIICGSSLSSFEIWNRPRPKKTD